MKYTPKIEKAIKTSARAHRKQLRKGFAELPYISHPFSVATIISEHTNDEDIICGGLLHDTLEDTDYSRENLLKDFGEKVYYLVDSVTEADNVEKEKNKLNENSWKIEKENYLSKLATSKEAGSYIISSADKIHNLITTIEYGSLVTRNHQDFFWFHEGVFNLVREFLGDHPIVETHKNILNKVKEKFQKS